MPAIRRPLRMRCNVQLSIVTDDRKVVAKKRQQPHDSSTPTTHLKTVTIPFSPPLSHSGHLQSYCELIPFLSIALSDGSFNPYTLRPPTTSTTSIVPFTHFIRIQYPIPVLNIHPGLAWSDYNFETGTAVLNLVIPRPQVRQEQTLLTTNQLLLSRDFLSLALPYYSRSQPPTWANMFPATDMVHVLITAPPGPLGCMGSSSTVDVMSVVACYLACAAGESVTTVVKCMDREMDGFGMEPRDVWKGMVKGEGIKVIQKVANVR